jgi:FixJ family two-component response regulator
MFPTILMTGRSDRTAQRQAEDLGALTLLDKPIDFSRLMEALDRAAAN